MAKEKLKNQIRIDAGLEQIGRKIGTTKAKKAITKSDFERLISFCMKSNYLHQQRARVKLKRAFTLLYLTGCRVSEITSFTSMDIREMIQEKEFSLSNQTKTKKSRLIVFTESQIEILKSILPPDNINLFNVTSGYLTLKCNDVMHKCLGELYSSHSFRAGYITRLAKNNVNIKLICEDIGHTNIATTAGYIKYTDEDKRDAKENINW